MNISEFQTTKDKNIIAYTIDKIGGKIDYYTLFKILFFAEKKHLMRYGDNFFNDTFHALPYGPAPTRFYDEIKVVKTLKNISKKYLSDDIKVEGNQLELIDKESINEDYISESEVECIIEAIEENKNLVFNDLKRKSHGLAWEKRKGNKGRITEIDIAEEENASEDFIKYLMLVQENKSISFK